MLDLLMAFVVLVVCGLMVIFARIFVWLIENDPYKND